eukprot:2645107-Amphidinium_carterae.1
MFHDFWELEWFLICKHHLIAKLSRHNIQQRSTLLLGVFSPASATSEQRASIGPCTRAGGGERSHHTSLSVAILRAFGGLVASLSLQKLLNGSWE